MKPSILVCDMSLVTTKPVFGVCDKVKPTSRATEASWRPEILDIKTRGIVYLGSENKGADQTARMRRLICAFVVRIGQKQIWSWRGSYVHAMLMLPTGDDVGLAAN